MISMFVNYSCCNDDQPGDDFDNTTVRWPIILSRLLVTVSSWGPGFSMNPCLVFLLCIHGLSNVNSLLRDDKSTTRQNQSKELRSNIQFDKPVHVCEHEMTFQIY